MSFTVAAVQTLMKSMGIAPAVWRKITAWRGKPSSDERKLLREFCRRLDERRVFYAPYTIEVVEVCVISLREIGRVTDEALAKVEHGLARAALGAILDSVRGFLDKWSAFHTHHGRDDETAAFFKDLGELRGRMRVFVGMLTELDPKATAPNMLGE